MYIQDKHTHTHTYIHTRMHAYTHRRTAHADIHTPPSTPLAEPCGHVGMPKESSTSTSLSFEKAQGKVNNGKGLHDVIACGNDFKHRLLLLLLLSSRIFTLAELQEGVLD
jgi:hypothetical protein